MKYLIFENNSENFYPLSSFKALWNLKGGIYSFIDRICLMINKDKNDLYYLCREQLFDIESEKLKSKKVNVIPEDEFIALNCLITDNDDELLKPAEDTAVYFKDNLVSAYFKNINYNKKIDLEENAAKLKRIDYQKDTFLADYTWDIVLENGNLIKNDYNTYKKNKGSAINNATICGEKDLISIGENVTIDPFVVLDSRKGPIVIEDGVEINSFTRIEGPCFIGANTVILGAKIREGCHIGNDCRIGGEVEDSIFHSFSNKYHDGFIGHAYIGEWVNLGALATNSDLKNDYSNVKCQLKDELIDSGSKKVGALIGDFSKASIGSLMNTGAVVGSGVMIVFTGRMTPPYLPDFSWFIKNEIRDKWNIDNFITTTSTVMDRRGIKLNPSLEKLIRDHYESTSIERQKMVEKWKATN